MTDFILDAIAWGGYFGIALLMALENVVPPVPSEVIMGLGGMAVARGTMSMVPLVLWGTVGSVAGNYFWYALGRRLGYHGLKPFVDRWGRWLTLEWEDVEKLERFFHSRGGWVVFVFRFMPTFRTMVSLPAGMACMPHWRFLLATFAGSAIWNAVLAWAGLYFGSNFRELERYVGPVTIGLAVAIALGYFYRVLTWKPRAER
ncbi:DedA family protein [Sphingomonas sp. PL-96]|uniref:DedA family protein n=1 Tax=Sphingomonas sp. PL-96 TaxID=2887201 RepID=UPI001E47CDC8|nr:DedA family protein [Sphingomonas sp. PL-96]MCC2975107.1 DedA family protein [Sphingomonas sp. PL-96]